MAPRAERIPEFEGLRALLAWFVVLAHFAAFSGLIAVPSITALYNFAPQAVEGFMILSGFAIARLLRTGISYGPFIVQRWFRLFPAFFFTFLVAACLEINFDLSANFITGSAPYALHPWWDFVSHAFMLHGLVPDRIAQGIATSYLPVAWSISLEWQFYLVAPWLVRFVYHPDLISSAVVSVLVLLRMLSHMHLLGTFDMNAFLPLRFELFLLGVASSRLWDYWPRASPALRTHLPWVTLLATLLVAVVTLRISFLVWSLICFTALECRQSAPRALFRGLRALLDARPVQWLGRVSYSTYLIHLPIIVGLHALIIRSGPALPFVAQTLLLAVLSPVLIVSGSALAYFWIEAPAIRFGKSLFSPSPLVPALSDK